MKFILYQVSLIGILGALALAPSPARAHGDEDHGGGAPAAVSAAGVPETQFELKIIDTSQNDPLLGGEVPLENAQVKATLQQDGSAVMSEAAHAEEIPGVYGVHTTLSRNGAYTLTWEVKPPKGEAFKVDFPIQVAGAPPSGMPLLSGWRLVAAILGALALLLGAFALGRMSGNGRNGYARVAALLLGVSLAGWSTGAWAHGGVNDEAPPAAAAAGPMVDLRVGVGDLATTTQTRRGGKYQVTLTVKVNKPAPFDPNHIRLSDEQTKTLGIQTVAARGGKFDTGLAVTGAVQANPASVVTISSRVPGKLRVVAANIGDRVRAGQTVAAVESTEIAEAQGAYSAAQSDVLAREAAYRQSLERVRIARRQLAQQQELARAGTFSQAPLQEALTGQAAVNSELATARADLASAQSQQAQAAADAATHNKALERIQELFDAGIRSKADLEAHQLEAEQDKARVELAQALVDQQQARVAQAQERVNIAAQTVARARKLAGTNVLTRKEIVQAQGALDNARLESAQALANLQAARRAVTAARSRLAALGVAPAGARGAGGGNQVTLAAPIEGIVTARSANVGETVLPEKALFTVLNPSVVWVEADVFEKDLPRVRVGLPARITTDAVPGKTLAGRISYIAATVDPETRAVRVRVAVANRDGVLRPGMFVRALLVTEARPRTVTVPDAAIQEDAGMKVVYVQEGDTYERREVAVGESAGGLTEIKSGVKPGEPVVTVGAYQLKSVGKA